MQVSNIVAGRKYYIAFVHTKNAGRTYHGIGVFLGSTVFGYDNCCLFRVGDGLDELATFPPSAVVHSIVD